MDKLEKTLIIMACVVAGIAVAVLLAVVALAIAAFVLYGDKNITEIPYWALFILGV